MALHAENPARYLISREYENRLPSFRRPISLNNSDDELPKDPRQWSREHVAQWLRNLSQKHNLPDVSETRFLMNGKALCLMSPGMFLSRVPIGGKLLYKDFQLRLCAALYARS